MKHGFLVVFNNIKIKKVKSNGKLLTIFGKDILNLFILFYSVERCTVSLCGITFFQTEDLKDCNTCTYLCIESYIDTLENMLTNIRRDLSATYLAKGDLQGYYYDWSRALDPENVF